MGGGQWSAASYAASTATKIKSGTSFSYDRSARSNGYKVHEDLDPTKLNSAGLNIRESRDSVEHPNSVPIVIALDNTGSMAEIPRTVQTKLAGFMSLLTRQGYVEDPQVAFSVYGDACMGEPAALQFSQFESDNRLDDALDNCVLYGGGGGNGGETASLNFYYTITHTVTDAWEKRGKRGYYFLIADEVPLEINAHIVKKYVGDGEPLTSLKNTDLANALMEKWDVYVLLIDNMTAKHQRSYDVYSKLFGKDHVIVIENPDTISEVIGLTIGVGEETVGNVEKAEADLIEVGIRAADASQALSAVKALIKSPKAGAVEKSGVVLDTEKMEAAARI